MLPESVAHADPQASHAKRSLFPPQSIHFFEESGFHPFVHPITGVRDFTTFQRVYKEDTSRKVYVGFFAHGFPYKILGIIPADVHLIGLDGSPTEGNLFLYGADLQGRDLFSRLSYATQTSMTIRLVGVALSLFFGVLLGAMSGYFGGRGHTLMQHVLEIRSSVAA